ncbi:alpha-mannosidase [Paenibacillus sp. FSL R7-0331]|uniref:alpha-mannosidase n=1 Tax=Paenibacillus sp. FSL R7-0331 TaxID=1536773 RepID=UPI0004F65642|nr:alpha-mannosidase [Paenibacillus sp. FSL R7-0331]AIQ50270.1 alpha-mannosidase [Paenibacillus sp. FSL R7-0331]
MFLTEEKLIRRQAEIGKHRYIMVAEIAELESAEDEDGKNGVYPGSVAFDGTIRLNERWSGRDRYVWLRATAVLPEKKAGFKLAGRFDFGKSGGFNNSGFESLLFVNGSPYQGVDTNHQEVIFGDELGGSEVELVFRLWSGLEGGGPPRVQEHKISEAMIGYLDERIDDLFYMSQAAIDTFRYLNRDQPEKQWLKQALDAAFRKIDWTEPGSKGHISSMYRAGTSLNEAVEAMPKTFDVTLTMLGHTHIDVAWLWQLKHTREKAARSFSTVLRLMQEYPEYQFMQSQPQLYAYLEQDYPELFGQIKERIKEGRWEPEGAMWLESDCNIPSGESLVRQILTGKRYFREQFGIESKYLWLPDVFGYSWALPQILRKSGIDTFMTTKISWNQSNRMPHDTFWWRGMDGSEVLTHFITTSEKDGDAYTYNGRMTAGLLRGIWNSYQDKEINDHLLFAYGWGDGGGGPTRDMLELRRRFDKLPGIPKLKPGSAGEYFDGLHERIENTDAYVHTWNGELYFECHRGTYTSQARNKKYNRRLELLLRDAEWLYTLAGVSRGNLAASYPAAELGGIWEILLRNQFHDIIPGSSIKEVYQDSDLEYAEGEARALALLSGAGAAEEDDADDSDGTPGYFTLLSSSSWEGPQLLELPGDAADTGVILDAAGQLLEQQRTADGGRLVYVAAVPAFGTAVLQYGAGPADAGGAEEAGQLAEVADGRLITPLIEAAWNGQGHFTSLRDRRSGRELLAPGQRGNVLQVFEDKPLDFEAWDIDIFYQEKMTEVSQLTECSVTENGPLRTVLRMAWTYNRSVITQDIIFYRDTARIDFRTEMDWQGHNQLLKAAFPVDVHALEATYDIQFGNVRRPTHWNTSWDYARFESVGHQWADVSEQGFGVALLNDCKYGYDIKDSVLRLTLLKSAVHPDPEQDQGHHAFTYALYPHEGDFIGGRVVQEAWELNNPLRTVPGQLVLDSLFSITGGHVLVDAVKRTEDGSDVLLRLHEYAGARSEVRIESGYSITAWQECSLMEEPEGEWQEQELAFQIKPYEIRTFRIRMGGKHNGEGIRS